jgi:methionyl-tRNA formyltransferase
LRILFFGTDRFALPTLKALVESTHEIITIVTQPDRPRGRGRKVEPTPVKKFAKENKIHCLEPENPKDSAFLSRLKSISDKQPDLLVLVAYGHILRNELLEIPRMGGINLHPSLLPKYRGAAPIQWAILKGEKTTGVTTIRISKKIDSGEILLQKEVPIEVGETYGELSPRLAEFGAQLILKTLDGVETENIEGRRQDDSKASHAPKIKKEDYLIDWSKPGLEIANQIRAFSPSPGAYTYFRGIRLLILKGILTEDQIPLPPLIKGEMKGDSEYRSEGMINLKGEELLVSTKDKLISIIRLKPSGKREMSIQDFINGYHPKSGEILG